MKKYLILLFLLGIVFSFGVGILVYRAYQNDQYFKVQVVNTAPSKRG